MDNGIDHDDHKYRINEIESFFEPQVALYIKFILNILSGRIRLTIYKRGRFLRMIFITQQLCTEDGSCAYGGDQIYR